MKRTAPVARCQEVTRSSGPLHPSVRVGGGMALEYCGRECVPGLVVCGQHATVDTLLMLAQSLRHDLAEATREVARLQRAAKRAKGGAA